LLTFFFGFEILLFDLTGKSITTKTPLQTACSLQYLLLKYEIIIQGAYDSIGTTSPNFICQNYKKLQILLLDPNWPLQVKFKKKLLD
jgi:hypothetical protein